MMDNNAVDTDEEFVLVYDAPDQATAELVCATLQASDIQAFVQNPYASPAAGWLPHLAGNMARGVVVRASEADAARAVLAVQEPTEEEVVAQFETDATTIEEAEARVK